MNRPFAELEGVSKAFGQGHTRVQALDGVDLQIHGGELTLIEGPSGSGKSTLLHILGLLQRADTGQVRIAGDRMDPLPESQLPRQRRTHVAFIFQVYNLLEALSAADNIALAGLLAGGSFGSVPIGQLLKRVNLQERSTHLPAAMSGGERQRAAIARALACPGRLVLADEPTANLDWENAREVIRTLADLAHQQGKAVVVVSHDTRLEPFADRIVTLLDGKMCDDRRRSEPSMVPPDDNVWSVRPTGHRRSAGLLVPALILLATAVAVAGYWLVRHNQMAEPAANRPTPSAVGSSAPANASALGAFCVAAAPAVAEPTTQLVEIRSERRGRIKQVLKHAGQPIRKGEPLVILDDDSAAALVGQRQADLMLAQANLDRLKAWDRAEKRVKADAGVERARARLDRAERELRRVQALYDGQVAGTTELDQAIEEQRLAAAELKVAEQIAAMSKAGPTVEEIHVAQAKVEQARAALHWAEAELALRTIVSPLDGHVIYRHLEPGEVVDPESPSPILSVGRLDDVRLRAEVDEADILRVKVGQRVIATAEAFGDRQITGSVVHLEPMMGRKNIRTERTTEQADTKVREVLIELDPDTPALPIDLQMTVRFMEVTAQNRDPEPNRGGNTKGVGGL
ncbi:MAG: ATP-binding cassette domain-containing protein [Phycisphaerae bacterium]